MRGTFNYGCDEGGTVSVSIEGFDSIITEAVERRIQASIAEAMQTEAGGIVERLVKEALSAKVKDGSRYRDIPFMEKLARDTIQEATTNVMRDWVIEYSPVIREALEKQIATQKFRKALSSAMLAGLLANAESKYFKVAVTYELEEK